MTKQEQLLNELVDCEIQRRHLEERMAALRGQYLASEPPSAKESRHISAASRARMSQAQRKRWAAAKTTRRTTPQTAALKKRWAAWRAGRGPRPGAR